MEDLLGTTIAHYRIDRVLGRGGFATVYHAIHETLRRSVALKVLHAEYVRDERSLRRFQREAQAIARLRHPGIVGVFDFGQDGQYAYLAMEYLEGEPLKRYLGQPVNFSFAAQVITAVADALDYAHDRGIVHRDVKPGNIMVTPQGRVVMTDFGIARITEASQDLTRGVIGTPNYMSPEQALGRDVDRRSDVYSLGVVGYELLTGRTPFRGNSPLATLGLQVNSPPPEPRSINPNLPVAAERVLLRALAKNPGERFPTAGAFASALAEALKADEEPRAVEPPPTPAPAAAPAAAPSGERIERLYQSALLRIEGEAWRWAEELLEEIALIDPDYRDVRALREEVRTRLAAQREAETRRARRAELFRRAAEAAHSGQHAEAVQALEELREIDPSYPDLERLLKRSRRLARLAELKESAAKLVRAGRWEDAMVALEEAKALERQQELEAEDAA